ncbi:putative alpha/beta hydrolase [[Mycobacterium] nativiensis]|uniref:Alpha/beta hydrolase n=1 Tax=[Mycobacterium] nativiensis TaxID=2855503 RepID=A0ABU5XYD8_9MYCO|nr:alpha/beta hydrolase [Mycolicibacter sp. MYC340]MEB3032994.1 alpha/beta hydrolase [Mycolicibacter sp. MYC340]
MSRPTLQHLQIADLIAHAGGDPWAVDDSLQSGSPTQINFLAQAFHQAAGSATSAEETFIAAQQHFEQYNRENGEQPINNGAEVQRVKDGLHATNAQLGQIAADLETIAAALAQARAASQANITALNANLIVLDARIGVYLDQENQGYDHDADIAQCRQLAQDDTATALHNATVIRNGYSKTLQQALTNLRVRDGYDPDAAVRRFDADAPAPPPGPVPDDPKEFNDYWNSLTPGQKDWLFNSDHSIGNHPGMPADPPDHLGYDHYNKLHLADELGSAQAAATQADALRNQHPDWAVGENIPRPNKPGAIFDDRVAYENWQRQYDAAREGAKYLSDLRAVDTVLRASPDRKLMLLDTKSGTQAHAAIAVGDPDKATHVSVTAPGLNTTVHGGIESMAEEATNVRREAMRQLGLTPGHATDSVSAIAWIGYDTPQVPGFDEKTASLAGLWDVTHDDLAKAGAHDLARFYDGIQASHLSGPADLTAIGHSYGSLTTGLALQEPGDHGVSRALFYGSPGIEASTPGQLHLQPGQVFAMEAPDDKIQLVYDARAVGQGIPIVGTYLNNEFGDFGPNPATNPEFTRLATGPSAVTDGHGGAITLEGAHGHSDYPRFPDGGGLRTTNYNIAAVLAGLGDKAVQGN